MSKKILLHLHGVEMEALAAEIVNRHHRMYKIVFINGYENVFYTDVETGNWIEEDLGFTSLAKEAGSQLHKFIFTPIHVPKLLTWHKQNKGRTTVCFGFYRFHNHLQTYYQIYNSNRKFLYTLVDMENEEWQIFGHENVLTKKIDTSLAQHIISILSSNPANTF